MTVPRPPRVAWGVGANLPRPVAGVMSAPALALRPPSGRPGSPSRPRQRCIRAGGGGGSCIRQRGAEDRRRRCGRAAVSAGEIGRVRLCRAAGRGRRRRAGEERHLLRSRVPSFFFMYSRIFFFLVWRLLPGMGGGSPARRGAWGERGNSPLHPLHPRTPLFAVTRKASLELTVPRPPRVAWGVGANLPRPVAGVMSAPALALRPPSGRPGSPSRPRQRCIRAGGGGGSCIRQRGAEDRRRRCGRAAVSAGEIGRVRLCRAAGRGRRRRAGEERHLLRSRVPSFFFMYSRIFFFLVWRLLPGTGGRSPARRGAWGERGGCPSTPPAPPYSPFCGNAEGVS